LHGRFGSGKVIGRAPPATTPYSLWQVSAFSLPRSI
jgi:hypothetical protein